ncbi:hypothetical protein F4X73_10105 [Candidatus Poribacteria bacterium]|nr:hypothetical protein [Candidatus Poribacteria bacterium]
MNNNVRYVILEKLPRTSINTCMRVTRRWYRYPNFILIHLITFRKSIAKCYFQYNLFLIRKVKRIFFYQLPEP